MKVPSDKLRTLLGEVIPSDAERCGPTFDDVRHLLRGERRRRSRNNAALVAGLAGLVAAILWKSSLPSVTPATRSVARTPPEPAAVVIRRVNDEQLFALLKDTPAAIIKSPDGTCRLLVIDQ